MIQFQQQPQYQQNNYKKIKSEISPVKINSQLINPDNKSDSDSDKKYICRYCGKRMNTVEKKCFNVCTCLFYIMCILLFPLYIIFVIIARSGPSNCCECECFDKDYNCPYCGGTIESYKSCPLYNCYDCC